MKKVLAITGSIILASILALFVIMYPAVNAMSKTGVVDIDAGLKIFTGGGGNSAVYVTPDKGVIIIVDTKMGDGSKKLKAYSDAVNPNAKVTIINTHAHPDHTGGNKLFPKAEFITGGYETAKPGVLQGMLIKAGETYTIKVPDDEIEIRNMGNAHSFADTIVYFKKRKLLVTGDLVFNGWHPVLMKMGGADAGNWVKYLEYMEKNYDAKTVVPGHGAVGGAELLAEQKAYFTDIKAALNDPDKLKALKEKYKGYNHMPIFTGFDKTVKFLK
jgi:cyclase